MHIKSAYHTYMITLMFFTINATSGIVASQVVASQRRAFLKVAAQVGYIFVALLDYIYIKA